MRKITKQHLNVFIENMAGQGQTIRGQCLPAERGRARAYVEL